METETISEMLKNFSKLVSYDSLPRKSYFIIWARPQTTFLFKLGKKLNNKNLAESSLLFNQATQWADIQLLECIFQNIFSLLTEAALKNLSQHPAGDWQQGQETTVGLSKGKSINCVTLVK